MITIIAELKCTIFIHDLAFISILNKPNAHKACKRPQGILKMDEVDFLAISSKTKLPAYAIEVEDATFCWMRYETCTVVGENDLDLMFVHDDQSKRLRKSPMESVSVTSLRSSSPPKKPGVYVPILVDIRFNIAKVIPGCTMSFFVTLKSTAACDARLWIIKLDSSDSDDSALPSSAKVSFFFIFKFQLYFVSCICNFKVIIKLSYDAQR